MTRRDITRFEFGAAVAGTFRTWATLFVPLTTLGLIAAIPIVILAPFFPVDFSQDGVELDARLRAMSGATTRPEASLSLVVARAAFATEFRRLRGDPIVVWKTRRNIVVNALAGAPAGMLIAVLYAMIDHDLRFEKEGVRREDLSKVFR